MYGALAAAPSTTLAWFEDPAGEHGTAGLEALADHLEPKLVESTERG